MKKVYNNVCSNCGTENPLYQKNCIGCKHYLRTTIVNIDLWSTIWQLFENPKKALISVIQAEHKNFVSFLLFFLATKLFVYSVFFQSAFEFNVKYSDFPLSNYLIQIGMFASIILILVKVLTITFNRRIKTRYKDNLALLNYSSIPIILSLLILSPVEYGIFGLHWFVFNPSPYIIKEFLAYIFSILELIMIGWSLLLFYKSCFLQSRSWILSLLFTFFIIIIIGTAIYYIPHVII